MDEEDHDELLQCTDDESLSENEDNCFPVRKSEDNDRHTLIYLNHSKLEFIITKLTLILSSTFLLILLPLYMEAINVKGDAYTLILTNTTLSTLLFIVIMITAKLFCTKYRNITIFTFPLKFLKLLKLATIYMLSAFMIIYSVDRRRVLCHLQDPIKGITLVFSLLFYFFFCNKLMGLQRIFSATTIIVGLFIAVDYGLCDEFRCRGYERLHSSDDAGHWSLQTHTLWISVYIIGLGLFAAYFTLLDRYLLINNDMESNKISFASFMSTVSRSVSFPSTNNVSTSHLIARNRPTDNTDLSKKPSIIHLSMWIHIFGLILIIMFFWTDLIPSVGKASSASEFLNNTMNGIICHFTLPTHMKSTVPACGNVFMFSWLFMCTYSLFTVMSLKFLVLSQSAVYTVSTISSSLPIVGLWWSVFQMIPLRDGLIIWVPSITGELICSLLGLPIVLIGLCLLCKSHFKDYQWSRLSSTQVMSSNHLA